MEHDGRLLGKRLWIAGILLFFLLGITATASAVTTEVGGAPFSFMGIIKQGAAYGIGGNEYDTKDGFQSFLTQIILEATYEATPNLKFFVSGKLNMDQAYPVLSNDDNWREKQFHHSRNQLYLFNDWQDMLGEAHMTWTRGNFYLRVGKQIVGWGETDGFLLMNQINPVDNRRGITDVEYENNIVPVTMLRAEYQIPVQHSDWLQAVNFQFLFNPNVQFRGNLGPVPGNDMAGIWAPGLNTVLGGPYPYDYAHIGSMLNRIDKPGDLSPEGFDYAGRITANVLDSRITLNGFYGRSWDAVTRGLPMMPFMEPSPWDRRLIIHPYMEGYYPYFKFVGGTFTRDLSFLKASALGGVSPVLRFEALYAFNSTFTTTRVLPTGVNAYEKYDELRWMAGMDWKIKIPILNPKSFFSFSGQGYNRRIMDYPSSYQLSGVKDDNWQTTLMISTSYFHTKLQPSFFWLRDWTTRSEFYRYQLIWEQSNAWKFTLGALFVNGSKQQEDYQALKNKDHVYFNVAYKF
jgi:hypothetical protein